MMHFSLVAAAILAGLVGFTTAAPTKCSSVNPPFLGTVFANPNYSGRASASSPPFSGTGLPNPNYKAKNTPPFSATKLPNPGCEA